ncbi:LysR substrate-binding domain-containing protein [Paenibacillus sp. 1P07SE]|uniref:LysR substrate-binding domain-containing protein n=1 Tax=Paenibacillus sp. 1P07SE TaxID=3132209 RepID=UPI0039A4289C
MNFIKLDILVLLDKHKKITAVAGALGVKQPTITFHMKSLEEQYGVPLFEMNGGKYELTRAGKALLHYARQIRSLGLEAGRVMAEQRSPDRGTFHIGASYVAGTYLLPAWIHRFRETYPEVEVRLTIRTAPVIRQLLAERRIDLGFISAQHTEGDSLHCEPLCADRLVVAFAADHPLAVRTSQVAAGGEADVETDSHLRLASDAIAANDALVASADRVAAGAEDGTTASARQAADEIAANHTLVGRTIQVADLEGDAGAEGYALTQPAPEDIAAYPFLFHGQQSTTREMTDRWAAVHGIELQRGMELDSLETIKRSLVLGKSVTFISHMAIREEIASGRLACAPLPGEHPKRMIYACYHPERWMSPQMSAFLELVRQQEELQAP